ncbi:MAG: hypothetical protein VYC39_00855 [Myxococcota bacterium]|nr:hypothetical protein [Myxococcota bacterium]
MIRVVFICSGNICRSPLAAGMATSMLKEENIPAVVISAGTLNINGQPAAPNAVEAGRLIGIDISTHRSQGISLPLMRMADALVVMAPKHETFLTKLDPNLDEKIVRMWEYGEHTESLFQIEDPVGQDLETFIECRKRLTKCLTAWVQHIKQG